MLDSLVLFMFSHKNEIYTPMMYIRILQESILEI